MRMSLYLKSGDDKSLKTLRDAISHLASISDVLRLAVRFCLEHKDEFKRFVNKEGD